MNFDPPRQLSWRDPSGFVVRHDERILRAVVPEHARRLRRLMDEAWYRRRAEEGSFPASRWLAAGPERFAGAERFQWLEHQALAFPCYPHEITALQLYDSARLTLDIAREALAHGWMLKDASAWNVLFDAGRPVFCDALSFVPLDNSGLWPAYAQACRHYVIPLLLYKELGIEPGGLFLTHPDGVGPEQARPMLKGMSAWRQPALETVTLPAALAGKGRGAIAARARNPVAQQDPRLGRHLLTRTLRRLEKHLAALKPRTRATPWLNYENDRSHYADAALAAKREFVHGVLAATPAQTVLDLGCNAGEFSKIAAGLGKRVVAADADHGALMRLYAEVREQPATAISPVMLHLGRPTPAMGWMNAEVPAFMERASGKFGCVLALGLMHHLLATERATLAMILDLFTRLRADTLIAEWIEPADPRFREIAGLNLKLYEALDARQFESVFSTAYTCVEKKALAGGTRTLYHWRKK